MASSSQSESNDRLLVRIITRDPCPSPQTPFPAKLSYPTLFPNSPIPPLSVPLVSSFLFSLISVSPYHSPPPTGRLTLRLLEQVAACRLLVQGDMASFLSVASGWGDRRRGVDKAGWRMDKVGGMMGGVRWGPGDGEEEGDVGMLVLHGRLGVLVILCISSGVQ